MCDISLETVLSQAGFKMSKHAGMIQSRHGI